MPKAGSTEVITIERRDAAGAVVTGLVQADFIWPAWLDGVVTALTCASFAEISGGKYKLALVMPATIGRIRVDLEPASGTDTIDPPVMEGRVTANDIDSVAVIAATPPSVALAANVRPGSDFSIEVYKGDGREITIPIYDDNGSLIDLTLWENFKIGIKNASQTVVGSDLPYVQTTGITAPATGLLVWAIPETCSAYNVHPAGHSKTTVYWSVEANKIADGNTKTRTLRAGPFVMRSKETP
jgi:hypothetical protein